LLYTFIRKGDNLKVGFFGGLALFFLTLVFSYIAIQNNKISREIVINSFALDHGKKEKINANTTDINASKKVAENIEKNTTKDNNTANKWKDFDNKFKNF